MNLEIRKVRKKDVFEVLNEREVWAHEFYVATKHRLLAHYHNPFINDDDVVLLIAYLDGGIVGYMGAYIDDISFKGRVDRIAWLSTWWVDPVTKGKGVGRKILETMYEVQNGKIGISEFTPSAKRVYDRSGYFYDLKKLLGCKANLRANLSEVLPTVWSWTRKIAPILSAIDATGNFFINGKLSLQYHLLNQKMKDVELEYLTFVDEETMDFVGQFQQGNLSVKTAEYFQYLKTYQWLQEAPLSSLDRSTDKYLFSSIAKRFNVFLVKVKDKSAAVVGFMVLLLRDKALKVFHVYFLEKDASLICDIVSMHAIKLGANTVLTYNTPLSAEIRKRPFTFFRTKEKQQDSIISKIYGVDSFEDYKFEYGDGDCSFT